MKVKKAWFVGVHGEVKRLPQLEGREIALKDMYGTIGNGCSIVEHVGLKKGVDMWVDEEGLLKIGFQVNQIASHLYRQAFPQIPPEQLGVVGNAIITDNTKSGDFITE